MASSRAIDYAKALDCRQLNCLVGIAPEGADSAELRATLIANLRFAAESLAKQQIRLLIEPINTRDIPGFFLYRHRTGRPDHFGSQIRQSLYSV